MASIIQSAVYQPLMSTYSAVGLNTPITRFLGTAIVTGGLMLVTQPSFAFDNGVAKPWTITNPSDKNATLFPWYIVPAAAGFFGGFMI